MVALTGTVVRVCVCIHLCVRPDFSYRFWNIFWVSAVFFRSSRGPVLKRGQSLDNFTSILRLWSSLDPGTRSGCV